MADLHTLVREQMERGGRPTYSFGDLDRRRHRKRRNERIAGGVIGLAVFALVATVIAASVHLQSERPATNDHSPTTSTPPPANTRELVPGVRLHPGRHWLRWHGLHISVAVPSGWEAWEAGVSDASGDGPPRGRAIGFWTVRTVYRRPCRWDRGVVRVGPTVDDLVTALLQQPGRMATQPTEVSIDGFSGKTFELHVPDDVDPADCFGGEYRSWGGDASVPVRYHQGAGQVDRLWILDVHGKRLVIDASYFPLTSDADRAELFAIVESVGIR